VVDLPLLLAYNISRIFLMVYLVCGDGSLKYTLVLFSVLLYYAKVCLILRTAFWY